MPVGQSGATEVCWCRDKMVNAIKFSTIFPIVIATEHYPQHAIFPGEKSAAIQVDPQIDLR
jgi:hypothetical protein